MYREANKTDMKKAGHKVQLADVKYTSALPFYPVDVSSFLSPVQYTCDSTGVPCHEGSIYHPTTIAHYALTHWNHYLLTREESHCMAFLAQVNWLIEHQTAIGDDATGWPLSLSHHDLHTAGPYLSASAQGCAISVLVRTYQLTQADDLLEVIARAVRTFERDILDGGVSTPIGDEGIFFEEVAVYPAAHKLSGFIFALLGLYDYRTLIDSTQVEELIERSLSTMHTLFDEFDVGFWIHSDLLHRQLSSPAELTLQSELLEALATRSGCEHCSTLATRWHSYQHRLGSRLRYLIINRCDCLGNALLNRIRSILFPKTHVSSVLRICVPIVAFPVAGGMRTVLLKIAQVTSDIWQIDYLTRHIGPNAESFVIHRFGRRITSPWRFPTVWLYCLAGLQKLIALIRHGANYDVILPQDGMFTAAFAAVVGKLAGVRVVCIDHGNLLEIKNRVYRAERLQDVATKTWLRRGLEGLLLLGYWPSLYLLAWFSAHLVDHFCLPGVEGDGTEEICRTLGIGPSRLTRFVNTVDMERHIIPDAASRVNIREKYAIAADAIVITMICRLAQEKGLDIALESISQALSQLSPEQRTHVRVIIAGDGDLRQQVEEDITRRGLSEICLLWGEASVDEVILLLGLSDIFLFTSRRAAGYPLAILEAMASGCAVVASDVSLSNERMLAEGRGMIVPVGDAKQTGMALVQLLNDADLRCRMGQMAKDYVALHNTATIFRRVLMRMTYWSELHTFLHSGMESER